MITPKPNKWVVYAKPAQMAFFQSEARYPLFAGSWGVGKSLFAILKCLQLCKKYPGNLGLICRKEYTDLRDSTINDFERYTGLRVKQQQKEVWIPGTNSKIIFRHADEFNVLQNITLGFFFIEQADEIENEDVFDFLHGRLRRGKFQQGILTANATDTSHWIYRRFKENPTKDPDYAIFEMKTEENKSNLPASFIKDIERLQKYNPTFYNRYVLNMWGISDDQFTLIPSQNLEALKDATHSFPVGTMRKKIIACDPSLGGDEAVAYVIEEGEIIDTEIYHERDVMVLVGHLLLLGSKHKINDYAIDVIGIGAGIASRLTELGKSVLYINSAEHSTEETCYNKRTEMWWYVSNLIHRKSIPYPEDPELRRQLSAVRYKVLNSSGLIQLEPKAKTKARLGCSPDRADAFIYGIWGLQFIKPQETVSDAYRRFKRQHYDDGNYMTV